MKKIFLLFGIMVLVHCQYLTGPAPELVEDLKPFVGLHVSASRGNDTTGDGSIAKPYQTIQKAIDSAAGLGLAQNVWVAGGTYTITAALDIPMDGISLYGGCNEEFNVRNSISKITTTSGDKLLNISSSLVTNNTIVDGFTFELNVTGSIMTIYGIYISSGSPIIQNNVIVVGINQIVPATDAPYDSYAVYVENSSTIIIRKNRIETKEGDQIYAFYMTGSKGVIAGNTIVAGGISGISTNATGLNVLSSTDVVVENNNIDAGQATDDVMGVVMNGAGTITLRGNTIVGGKDTTGCTAVMDLNATADNIIEANSINGGACTSYNKGIYVSQPANGSPVTSVLKNNIVGSSGTGAESRAIQIGGGAESLILQNNIDTGSATSAYGITSDSNAHPKISNNIFSVNNPVAGMISYCISESSSTSDPQSVDNNKLSVCDIFYRDNNGTPVDILDLITSIDNSPYTSGTLGNMGNY